MKKTIKIIFLTVAALAASVVMIGVTRIAQLPDEIYIPEGGRQTLDICLPIDSTIRSDSVDVVGLNGETLSGENKYFLGQPVEIEARGQGTAFVSIQVFGIPVKDITVKLGGERMLVPGGNSIGVMLYTNGALVVGGSDVVTDDGRRVNPARDAGLRSGDIIEMVNGEVVEDAAHLRVFVSKSSSENVHLVVRRGEKTLDIAVTPVTDPQDGSQKLGVWVRDSTAGVGTLTFYDKTTGRFAGLGHAITDADTGQQLSVKNGEIVESSIIEIVRGTAGEPGELKGYFNPGGSLLGHIYKNTIYGIYGDASQPVENPLYPDGLAAADRTDIHTGPATILCTLDDSGIHEYDVQITHVNAQSEPEPKSFVVKVTDQELLDKTGGIVQGMSGSTVIQDGKIAGAVTHVFVNDPTQGYGLYADWMLSELDRGAD